MVRERKQLGEDDWKKKYGYGMRWAAEGFISGVKRVMGERVRASSSEGMEREMMKKEVAVLQHVVVGHTTKIRRGKEEGFIRG